MRGLGGLVAGIGAAPPVLLLPDEDAGVMDAACPAVVDADGATCAEEVLGTRPD